MSSRVTPGDVLAFIGMACVGSSVAVSQALTAAPLFTVQAARYTLAAALLLILCVVAGRPLSRPRGTEWAWLCGVAATGLVLFNIALVRGVEHAEPAVIGIAVASVPLLLAVLGPLLSRSRPAGVAVIAAGVVTVGAVLVNGGGRTDAAGLGWAAIVLLTEAAFTLLAIPVLTRLGPWVVSLHTTWIAAVGLGVAGVAVEGPAAILGLQINEAAAAIHLAVVVTALAFVLWYSAVRRIGPGRAGLFTGVVPIVAAGAGMLLGAPTPAPLVWLGVVVVIVGITLGLAPRASLDKDQIRDPQPALVTALHLHERQPQLKAGARVVSGRCAAERVTPPR